MNEEAFLKYTLELKHRAPVARIDRDGWWLSSRRQGDRTAQGALDEDVMDDAFISVHEWRRLDEIRAPYWQAVLPIEKAGTLHPTRAARATARLCRWLSTGLTTLATRPDPAASA